MGLRMLIGKLSLNRWNREVDLICSTLSEKSDGITQWNTKEGERNKDKDKMNVCPHAEAHDNACIMTSMYISKTTT